MPYCINKCDNMHSNQSSVLSSNKCSSSASSEHFHNWKNSSLISTCVFVSIWISFMLLHVLTHHFGHSEHDVCRRSSRPSGTQWSRIPAGRLSAFPRGSDPGRIHTQNPRTLVGVKNKHIWTWGRQQPWAMWHWQLHCPLTECLRQPINFLAVDICLVPDKVIGEVRRSWEPLPEEPSLDGHHEVHFHQAERDGGVGQGDAQEGLIPRRPAAQVPQTYLCTWDPHFLLEGLGRERGENVHISYKKTEQTATNLLILWEMHPAEKCLHYLASLVYTQMRMN